MIDTGAIDEKVLELWPKQKLVIALKMLEGRAYIDVRKWIEVDGKLTPRKGIMLSVEHWPHVIKEVQAMLDSHMLDRAA